MQPAGAEVSGGGSRRDAGWAHGPGAASDIAQGLQSALLGPQRRTWPEHGPNMDKGCSEQGSHGSPGLPLLLLTCRGLWLWC